MDYSLIIGLILSLSIICVLSFSSISGLGGVYVVFKYMANIIKQIEAWIKNPLSPFGGKTPLGGKCKLHTDCIGWGPAATDAACCKGICTTKMKDWAGVGYCPDACVGKAGGKPGTCTTGGPGQPIGGKCTLATDCKNYGEASDNIVCCDNKCTKPKCTKLGVGYCPKDCPQPLGGSCTLATDCKNYGESSDNIVCCDGKCTKPKCTKLGVGYCPKDCPQPLGGKCTLATDCKNYGESSDNIVCCDGKCTKPKCTKLGVGYCPKDCPKPIGGKCVLATDCEGYGPKKGIVCCDGKCSKPGCKKGGIWFCEKECGLKGDKCDAPSGTIWPLSGCDASAGLCCKGKCSTSSSCDCKTFDEGCSSHTQCCTNLCNQLGGIAARAKCPAGYKDHGSYACCKYVWGGENKHDCHKWSCGFKL